MDRVLAGISCQVCLVSLGEVLAHRCPFQATLRVLRWVLQIVTAVGLLLHPEKCCLMRKVVEFLGHILVEEGISTLEEKVQMIRDWPTHLLINGS